MLKYSAKPSQAYIFLIVIFATLRNNDFL
jgi:hypothetical protein